MPNGRDPAGQPCLLFLDAAERSPGAPVPLTACPRARPCPLPSEHSQLVEQDVVQQCVPHDHRRVRGAGARGPWPGADQRSEGAGAAAARIGQGMLPGAALLPSSAWHASAAAASDARLTRPHAWPLACPQDQPVRLHVCGHRCQPCCLRLPARHPGGCCRRVAASVSCLARAPLYRRLYRQHDVTTLQPCWLGMRSDTRPGGPYPPQPTFQGPASCCRFHPQLDPGPPPRCCSSSRADAAAAAAPAARAGSPCCSSAGEELCACAVAAGLVD